MADEIVSADSASTTEAATGDPGQAVVSDDATHGAETSETPTDTSEAEPPTDADLDDDEESPSEEQTEEEKTRAQKRRERRVEREQKRIAEAVQAEISRRETEQATKAAADNAAKAAEKAQTEWRERFGSFVGTPEQRAALAKEIDDLIQTTISVNPEEADYDQLQSLTQAQKALAAKRAEIQRLDTNARTYDELDRFHYENTKAVFADRASSIPEANRSSYLSSQTIPQALERLEAGIRADEQAKAKAAVARVESEWSARFEKKRVAAHAATRTGGAGAGPSPNGSNGSGSGGSIYTRERLRQMLGTAAGLAEYNRNRVEIERQEAAGLIR